jgi:hypothetical protein
MVRPNGQLVLIDFGAVREVTPTLLVKAGAGQLLTGICSPGYAPPEQIEGRPLPQSDFFALGRTMVHLLTGKHPLNLAVDVYTGNLLWRNYAPTITEPLADLIDDLMAPLPGKRPPNIDIIKQRLAAIAGGKNWELARQERCKINSPPPPLSPLPPNPQRGCRVPPPSESLEADQETAIPPKEPNLKKRVREIIFPWGFALAAVLGWIGFRWGTSQIAIAYHEQGVTHQVANKLYLAQVDFKRSLTFKPDYPEAHFHLGRNYELLGDIRQARIFYEKAKRGKLAEAYSNLARLDIVEGNYDKAVPLLTEGLKLTHNNAIKYALLKNLGWAYLGQNRYQEAEVFLQQAIHLNKEKASAYCLLAQAWEARGEQKSALVAWTSCRRYASLTHPDEKQWRQEAEKRLTATRRR